MNLSSKTVVLPSIVLLIGTVLGTTGTNAFAADDPFKNKVEIDTEGDNKNTCKESGDGSSTADCSIHDDVETDAFTVQGEKNKISLDFKGDNLNDCDEEDVGNHDATCEIFKDRNIGQISILKDLP